MRSWVPFVIHSEPLGLSELHTTITPLAIICLFGDLKKTMSFSPICGGSDYGYLPSKSALRHTLLHSNGIGPKKPEYASHHHLRTQNSNSHPNI